MNLARMAALAAFAASGIPADSPQAQTRWNEDSMSVRCSPASRAHVAAATRRSIEERVARAESSIQMPGGIADMSCIESLLAADIDVFSGDFANVCKTTSESPPKATPKFARAIECFPYTFRIETQFHPGR